MAKDYQKAIFDCYPDEPLAVSQLNDDPSQLSSFGVINAETGEEFVLDTALVEAKAVENEQAAPLGLLRYERNKLLAGTDWWASSDLTMTAEQIAYRQALRDITDTYSSLDDVVWPTKPE